MKGLDFFKFNTPFEIEMPLINNFDASDNIYLIKQIINKINGFDIGNKYLIHITAFYGYYDLVLTNKNNNQEIIYKNLDYNQYIYENEIKNDMTGDTSCISLINQRIDYMFKQFIDYILNNLSGIYNIMNNSKLITPEDIVKTIPRNLSNKFGKYNFKMKCKIYPLQNQIDELISLLKSIKIINLPNMNVYQNDNKYDFTKYYVYKIQISSISYETIQEYFELDYVIKYFKNKINSIDINNFVWEYLKLIDIFARLSENDEKIDNINLKFALIIRLYEKIIFESLLKTKVFEIINGMLLEKDENLNFEGRKLLACLYGNGINDIILKTITNLFNCYYLYYQKYNYLNNYSTKISSIRKTWGKTNNGFLTKEFNLTGNSLIMKFINESIDLPRNFIYHLVYKFDLKNSEQLNYLLNSPLLIDTIINYDTNHEILNEFDRNVYFTKSNFDTLIKLFVKNLVSDTKNIENYLDGNSLDNLPSMETQIFSKTIIFLIILLYINESIIYNFEIDPYQQNSILFNNDYDLTEIYLNITNNEKAIYDIIGTDLKEYYDCIIKLFTNNIVYDKIFETNSNINIKIDIALFIVIYSIYYDQIAINHSKNFDIIIESLLTVINPYFKNNIINFVPKLYQRRQLIENPINQEEKEYLLKKYKNMRIMERHNISVDSFMILLELIKTLNTHKHLELLLELFNSNTYEIELYDGKYYQNEVLNEDLHKFMEKIFETNYLSNFYNNIKIADKLTINSNFIYSIKETVSELPLFSNAMISEFKEEKQYLNLQNPTYGRMFFDIEDIHKDSNHYYNDIIIYINMLIDDLCEMTNTNDEEKKKMKKKCIDEFIVTTNTSSAHGISYHVYLPLKCNYLVLKDLLKRRKKDFKENIYDKNLDIECVYSYVDPLVYSQNMTSIRVSFYGKGNLKLEYRDLEKELTSNSSIKELIEFEEWLYLIKDFDFDNLKNIVSKLPGKEKDNIEDILGIENLQYFIETNVDNIKYINSELVDYEYEIDFNVMYKKRNLILLFMLQQLLTKPNLNTRILQKPFNMHLLYKVGNGLLEKINKEIIEKNINNEQDKKEYCLKKIIEQTLITNTEDCLEWNGNPYHTNPNWVSFIKQTPDDINKRYFEKISNETISMTNYKIESEREFKNTDFEYYIKLED